jgi:hypothetical protein
MIRAADTAARDKYIARLGSEIEGLVKGALEISWFSRGAWSYQQVLQMTQAERELAVDFINKRLEIAAKTMYPVY